MKLIYRTILVRIAVIIGLIILTGCSQFHIDFSSIVKPNSLMMELPEDAGPPIYRQAYKDGCESGFSGYANQFNKMFWTWKQDPALAQDKVYYQMWKDAYAYCANYGMMADEHGLGNWR